ncbi:hypothetical protein LTR84_009557 [Exophiala bonariae]|uniref:Uncharacterized protein n=1 Tax=Exophiala bonariae TaxID=1690606 RepID=A0AAV9MUV6_9EURO|nr:hypothetical protein LTR84_009557 [Exophiala bonariae]
MPYYRDIDDWSETDDEEVEDEVEAESHEVEDVETGDVGYGDSAAESEQEVAETPPLQNLDKSPRVSGLESSPGFAQISDIENTKSTIAKDPTVSTDSEAEPEPDPDGVDKDQQELLNNSTGLVEAKKTAKFSNQYDTKSTNTFRGTTTSQRIETGRELEEESEDLAQREILAKFTQISGPGDDQATYQRPQSQSTISNSYPVDMRVSNDAWSSSSESGDDEDNQHDAGTRQQPPLILLSSDSEETEPTSNRKRKRTTPLPTQIATSESSKRPRTSLRRSSSPHPLANVMSDLGPLQQPRTIYPQPATSTKPQSDQGRLLQHHLPPSLPPINVVPDQDPLLQSHLIHLLPSHLLSVGSKSFPTSNSTPPPRLINSHASNATSNDDEDSPSQPTSKANSPLPSTDSPRWPKSLLSHKKTAVKAREERKRRTPLLKLFNRRYLADRSATLSMVGNLSKDSRWAQLTAEQREAVKAQRTLELMERRFREGKSQSAVLARLLPLVAQKGYSEGVLLRLLLQRDSCQKVLGEVLKDVVDVDAGGEVVLKGEVGKVVAAQQAHTQASRPGVS